MKLAILTCGMLPIPAVQGGAVENLIDFYLEYNNREKLHDITIYSPWNDKVQQHPALLSDVNHYHFIDVTSIKARLERRIYKYFHYREYYNYFIEYYFEKAYTDIKKNKFDYIILENGVGLAYKLSIRGYKNIILHLHNEIRDTKSRYNKVIFNNITKIITVSDYIKRNVSLYYPINKIQTVHNGIDLKNFSPKNNSSSKRQELGLSNKDFVIVYSGRINKEKGVSELIDAFLQLPNNTNIKLIIIGSAFFADSDNKNEFIQALKEKANKIKDKIVFTGFIQYEQIPSYLKIADIAVLPSMWEEPFGLTIIESMAVGLPVITTHCGGIPEICEGVATIVERKNIVKNLKSAILNLYQNPPKRQQMAAASIERAKLYDKKIYAENFFSSIKICNKSHD